MTEQQIQTKILKYLKSKEYYTFKTILCNRAGIPDIIGCTLEGKFFAIEVKKPPRGKLSKLQEWNIASIRKLGAIAIVAHSLDDVKEVL